MLVGGIPLFLGGAVLRLARAIFGFGRSAAGNTSITNLVSNTGVVANDTPGVGTARYTPAAAGFDGDKAIFIAGEASSGFVSMTNIVSNTGVVATDTSGVTSGRSALAAAGYGGDKAIFGFGNVTNVISYTNYTHLISNTGVVSGSVNSGVGTARSQLAAASFGG